MKKLAFLLMMFVLLAAACGKPEPGVTPSTTSSPSLLPTGTPTLPEQTLPPTLTATPLLIDGVLTIKVNVRSGPGTSYGSLGQLEAGERVQVISSDSQRVWYQILYPAAPQGRGWVAAQYVTITPGTQIPLDVTPTPAGPTGNVVQRLNVRSGPGTSFESLGTLEAGVMVALTGKNTTASWFQIDYASGPSGRGWVTSQYIQTDASAGLPVLDDYGHAVTPGAAGTPAGPFQTPTLTVGPAFADGDLPSSPSIRVAFSPAGTHRFIYSSQVSAPQGDSEDWVEFTPYSASGANARLEFSLTCTGNATLAVELWQGGTQLSNWGGLECGDTEKLFLLPSGQAYQVRLAPSADGALRLVAYTLTVQNNP